MDDPAGMTSTDFYKKFAVGGALAKLAIHILTMRTCENLVWSWRHEQWYRCGWTNVKYMYALIISKGIKNFHCVPHEHTVVSMWTNVKYMYALIISKGIKNFHCVPHEQWYRYGPMSSTCMC